MSRIVICTDSTAVFAEGSAIPPGVSVVPIHVVIDGEPYEPGDLDAFYDRLSGGAHATTSTPSPGDFLRAYERAAGEGATEVMSVHVDARVSATVTSALLAARESSVAVTVVDSGTASFGLGVCVSAAAEAVSDGASAAATARRVRRVGRSLRSVFVAPSAPGGRIHAGGSWTVLSFANGTVRPERTCSSAIEATEVMAATVLTDSGPRSAAVGYASAGVGPWADTLAELLRGDPEIEHVARYRLTEPVGAHTGPLSFGAFWWPPFAPVDPDAPVTASLERTG